RLLRGYRARRRAECEQLGTALADGDFQTVSALAHGLVGSGGLYGLQAISDIGASLEAAANAGDAAGAQAALAELREYFARLVIE
ncbi:MAG: Hpt domain-containing protein, partial [Pseudomonadota bacterium]